MTSLLCALVLAAAAPVPEDKKDDAEFQKKVDAARAKAVKYLKDKQKKDGDWEGVVLGDIVGLKGGVTALATLSLLEAGVPTNDPTVAKAVEYLLKVKPEKTYVVSLQTQVLARVDAKKYAKEIQANADWLLETAIKQDGKLEGWSYPYKGAPGDNSNTHFAVMGLHAAAQAGAKVDPEIWRKIRDYYANTQKEDGSWAYTRGNEHASHSMTVAALLCLKVATKYDKQAKGPDPAFEKGMKLLLGGKFGELGEGKSVFVSWMTTAELGRALGATEFKSGKVTKDWYREGAVKMLKCQEKDGSITGGEGKQGGGIDSGQPVITTACGLYFLGPPAKR